MSALDEASDSSSDGEPEIGLDALRPEALAALPLAPLLSLLGDDDLGVESEDQVTP